MTKPTFAVATCAALAALSALVAIAGPLDPPPGPVAPTLKTLTEVEPRTAITQANTPGNASATFVISQPGSYYLTADLLGQAARNGISIAASNVTIDLNGFTINGQGLGSGGILSAAAFTNITIRNGAVANWTSNGLNLLGGDSVVESVSASGNAGAGISAGPHSVVRNCVANSNAAAGIAVGDQGAITGCQARSNNLGISAGARCTISDCFATTNTLIGITAGVAGRVTQCSAGLNGSDGIQVSSGALVSGCTSFTNTGNGIEVSNDALVIGNICDSNGTALGDAAGIRVAGSDNRIQGNICTDADRGIEVDIAGNIITGNTCSGNGSNFDFVANNYYGAIINRDGTVAPVVNGSAAPSTLATTDPHANFSF